MKARLEWIWYSGSKWVFFSVTVLLSEKQPWKQFLEITFTAFGHFLVSFFLRAIQKGENLERT